MIDRRRFMTILGATVAAAGVGNVWAPKTVAEVAGRGSLKKTFTFFTAGEADFIKSAVARLIPADVLGPGALEADVPYFIDQQLAGAFGAGARFYNQGPFAAQTPFQGYQWPLSPAELYRVGIAATDQYCQQSHSRRFAKLNMATQDEVLKGLEGIANAIELKDIPGTAFFTRLLTDTKDGFFADPCYGGNRDMVGWKLVGFPGVPANYSELIDQHNQPYVVEPADIRALQEAHLPADHHGHPIHRHVDASKIRQTIAPSAARTPAEVVYEWKPLRGFFV